MEKKYPPRVWISADDLADAIDGSITSPASTFSQSQLDLEFLSKEEHDAIVQPLVEALSQIAGMRFVAHNRPLDVQMIAVAMKALENYKKQIEKI